MVIEARELGLRGIVAIGSGGCDIGGVSVIRGALVQESTVKGALAALKRVPRDAALVIVNAGDNAFNRTLLSQRKVGILRHMYKTDRDAFDHVTARMAADRGVAVDLDLRPIIQLRGPARQKVLQRYGELLTLQRRYGFPFTLSTSAFSVLEQRSVRDMIGLCAIFGMEKGEAIAALGAVERIIAGELKVRVVR
jgi:ribonuclease P/MRP protein subunit RPP1